jgi:hypothetical protein
MAGNTKGVSFYNAIQFAQERFGEAGWQTVLSTLTIEEQRTIAAMIPMGWYDLDLYARVLKHIVRLSGAKDSELLISYGHFAAEQDLSKLHKIFMRVLNPGQIFDQAMKVWTRFQDTGSWVIERKGKQAVGTLTDWGCVEEVLCLEMIGYLEALLRLSHGKDATVRHTECRVRGAKTCVFLATWR